MRKRHRQFSSLRAQTKSGRSNLLLGLLRRLRLLAMTLTVILFTIFIVSDVFAEKDEGGFFKRLLGRFARKAKETNEPKPEKEKPIAEPIEEVVEVGADEGETELVEKPQLPARPPKVVVPPKKVIPPPKIHTPAPKPPVVTTAPPKTTLPPKVPKLPPKPPVPRGK